MSRPERPLDHLLATLAPLGIAIEPAPGEGTTLLFDCIGPDQARWSLWLASNDGKQKAFAHGEAFLLGYRGTPPTPVFAALEALAQRLRDLEARADISPWFTSQDPVGKKPAVPTLIYGQTRLELRLTLMCNEKCVFCNSAELAENMTPTKDEALALLVAARQQGAYLLVLTGGEPLLVDWLPDIAKRARELGYLRTTIQTNGALLHQPEIWQRLIAAAPDELLISLHGSDDDVIAAVSGRPGLFHHKLQAIARCSAEGYRVSVSFVICRQNRVQAAATMEILARLPHPPAMVAFSFVAPSGAAARAGKETISSMTGTAPYLLAGLHRARELGLSPVLVEYCGMPTCIAPELRRFAEPFDPENPLGVPADKRKLPVCHGCVWDHRCSGIFRGYLDLYGDEEFTLAPASHRDGSQP